MPNPVYGDVFFPVVDCVERPEIADPDTITVGGAGEFFCAMRPGIMLKGVDRLDCLTIMRGRYFQKLLLRLVLDYNGCSLALFRTWKAGIA